MKSRALAIFAAISAALTMSQFMRAAVSVVAPDIIAETQLSVETYGTMAGGFFLGVAVAQIPSGMLFDRYGPRITIAVMLVLAALATFAFAAADGYTALFASRFVTGIGFASTLMGALVVTSRWFPPERFSQIAGLFIAVSGAIGMMSATTPMAVLSGVVGWRQSFAIAGGCTLVTAVLVLWAVRDAPPGHAWHSRAPEHLGSFFKGYGALLRLPRLGYVMLMAGVGYPLMITLIGVWGGPYLHDVYGLGPVARGHVLSIMVAGSVTGLLVYGPLDRWLDSRKSVVIGGTLISASLLATLALMAHPPLILVTVLLALYGIAGSYYITNITLGRAHYPDHLIGRGVTLINLCTFIGVAVVQFSTAYLMGFFAMGEGNAAAPVLAYRILFGAFAAYTLIIGLLYTRAHDIKPSAERARRQKAESPDSRAK